jgi:GNAT superfamily N-acetyltransferase
MMATSLAFKPLTTENWDDLVELFEGHGNPGYCWCTFWRLSSRAYAEHVSSERREVLHRSVRSSTACGMLAYRDRTVIGWCSIAPRQTYERLNRSRTLPRIDERNTWSLVCFYINKQEQGQGLSSELLKAAVEYAASRDAEVVEAYPVDPEWDQDGNWHPAKSYRFMGYRSTFEKAGFQDVTPEGGRRTIMRLRRAAN